MIFSNPQNRSGVSETEFHQMDEYSVAAYFIYCVNTQQKKKKLNMSQYCFCGVLKVSKRR